MSQPVKQWQLLVAQNEVRPSKNSLIVRATVAVESELLPAKEVIDGQKLHESWQAIVKSTHPTHGDLHAPAPLIDPANLDAFLAIRTRAVSGLERWGPNCVPAGTPILMSDRSEKPVEQITVGDKVITHTGESHQVTKLFSYDNYKHKELLGIRSYGWCEPLWLTPDQKVWALKQDEFSILKREIIYSQTCPTNERKRDFAPNIPMAEARKELACKTQMRWIPANELRRNDVISMQFDDEVETTDEINSSEMARLLGYYLSEGCRRNNGIIFVTHVDEIEFRADLDTLAERFDRKIYHHSVGSPNAISTYIGSNGSDSLIALCEKHCGKYSNKKSLSNAVMRMPHEWQREFLLAYLTGDGSQHKEDAGRYAGTIRGVTSSIKLAKQLQEIMWRMRIPSSVSGRMNPGRFGKGFEKAGMIYEVSIGSTWTKELMDKKTHWKFSDMGMDRERHSTVVIGEGFVYLPISKIFNRPYDKTVYDFEVEKDLSYVANRITVFDCNGDGFPAEELIKSHKGLIAKGFYREHNSYDPANAIGIIASSEWLKPWNDHYVMAVALVDKEMFPQDADEIGRYLRKQKAGVSIGCIAGTAECSVCGNIAHNRNEICFAGDTLITMASGKLSAIADVKCGDFVIDAQGNPQEVLRTLSRAVSNERVISCSVRSKQYPIVATANHPFLALRQGGTSLTAPHRQEIGALSAGDFLYTPTIGSNNENYLTAEQMRWLGWYAAEGSVEGASSNRGKDYVVGFSLGGDEHLFAEEICALTQKLFNKTPHIYGKNNGRSMVVKVSSVEATEFALRHCGRGAKTKELSFEIMNAPASIQKKFLGSLLLGDGCWSTKGRTTFVLGTASYNMAHQIHYMSNNCGISSRVRKVSNSAGPQRRALEGKSSPHTIYHVYFTPTDSWKLSEEVRPYFAVTEEKASHIRSGQLPYEGGYISKIEHLSPSHYTGRVYNLSVNNTHTYLAGDVAAFNCGHMLRGSSMCVKGRIGPHGTLSFDICRDLGFYELSYTKAPADRDAFPPLAHYVLGFDINSITAAKDEKEEVPETSEAPSIEKKTEGEKTALVTPISVNVPNDEALNKLVDSSVNKAFKSRLNKLIKTKIDQELGPVLKQLQIRLKPDIEEMVDEKKDDVQNAVSEGGE